MLRYFYNYYSHKTISFIQIRPHRGCMIFISLLCAARLIIRMSEQFVGCTVSVKCIEEVGTYQGQIVDLNKDCVILSKAFCNGVPHSSPIVILWYRLVIRI